jgi:5-methylcytosine-specific restriction enzyme subunit McrC
MLIRLLVEGCGIGTIAETEAAELPGFLFDMNRLYQDAIGRFLLEWLADAKVSMQFGLSDVFRYEATFNPRQKRTPTPRPDFVVWRQGRLAAIADAKYRDLWEHELPRDMLYQLTIYALSQRSCTRATILYPTNSTAAREARIAVNDPLTSEVRGEVCLRPIVISEFSDLVAARRTATANRRRQTYAEFLAFGD